MLFQHLSVLIVDDEVMIRMNAADMLSDAGFIFEAANAAEALLILEAHDEIMLVFTDVNMPGAMDGVALLAHVHGIKPLIQWIVTSGLMKLNDVALPGRATFLPKPYQQAKLLDLVARKLEAIT